MKKIIILILSLVCCSVQAKSQIEQCLDINKSLGKTMLTLLLDDLTIYQQELQLEKTKIELINEIKVDYPFADYLAKKDIMENNKDDIALSKLRAQYMADSERNSVIKFTFVNKENKKAVFIASTLINKDDCSVAFNGYLIVKREF